MRFYVHFINNDGEIGYSFITYSSTTLLLTFHEHTRRDHSHQYTSKSMNTLSVPKLETLFAYPTPPTYASQQATEEYIDESIFGITPDFCVIHIRIEKRTAKLILESCVKLLESLPLLSITPANGVQNGNGGEMSSASTSRSRTPKPPDSTDFLREMNGTSSPHLNPVKKIVPVDPMAWGWSWDSHDTLSFAPSSPRPKSRLSKNCRNGRGAWEEHDVLLSVSECGELRFWVPSVGSSIIDEVNGSSVVGGEWRCTGRVRTERRGFNRVRCSSAKKTALGPFLFKLLYCLEI